MLSTYKYKRHSRATFTHVGSGSGADQEIAQNVHKCKGAVDHLYCSTEHFGTKDIAGQRLPTWVTGQVLIEIMRTFASYSSIICTIPATSVIMPHLYQAIWWGTTKRHQTVVSPKGHLILGQSKAHFSHHCSDRDQKFDQQSTPATNTWSLETIKYISS